jgi:RasGEF domain
MLNSPLDMKMPSPVRAGAAFVIQNGIVKYCLAALISQLTTPKPNSNINHFEHLNDTLLLLCFRCFSTPEDVERALVARFQQSQPKVLTSEQESASHLHMQAIRLLVASVLCGFYWVHEDGQIVAPLKQCLPKTGHPGLCREARCTEATNGVALGVKIVPATRRPSAVGLLDTCVLERSSGEDALNSVVLADNLIRNDDVAHLLVFNSEQHCTELALQLTLFMSAQFRSVDPEKLWHHLYWQCRSCHIEKKIDTLRRHALALRAWTATSIVEQNDPETRVGVMTFLISLAFVSLRSR